MSLLIYWIGYYSNSGSRRAAPPLCEGRPPVQTRKEQGMTPEELMIERAAFDTDYPESTEIEPKEISEIDDLLYVLEEKYAIDQEIADQERKNGYA